MDQAVSTNGQLYTALPTAFRYRKELVSGCSCRKPGESWADALKNADDSSTLESGDIVVTDKNAKTLSQPPRAGGKTIATAAAERVYCSRRPPMPPLGRAQRPVRMVGPPFLSQSELKLQQQSQQP